MQFAGYKEQSEEFAKIEKDKLDAATCERDWYKTKHGKLVEKTLALKQLFDATK